MDPLQVAIDLVGAIIKAVGPAIAEAAFGHHGYVPRRVEAILGPDDKGKASAAAEELRGTPPAHHEPAAPAANGPEGVEVPHGSSTRGREDACSGHASAAEMHECSWCRRPRPTSGQMWAAANAWHSWCDICRSYSCAGHP